VKIIPFLFLLISSAVGTFAQYTWTTNIVWTATNPTSEPVTIRLLKRTGSASTTGSLEIGGTTTLVQSVTIEPGEEHTFSASHTGTVAHPEDSDQAAAVYQLSQLSAMGTLTGDSYVVGSGEPTGPEEWNPISMVKVGALGGVNGDPLNLDFGYLPANLSNRESTPDFAKTLWRVTDTTLTADLYREGVDKMVYAAASGAGGGGGLVPSDIANIDDVSQRQIALSETPEAFSDGASAGVLAVGASRSATAKTAIAEAVDTATNEKHTIDAGAIPAGVAGNGSLWHINFKGLTRDGTKVISLDPADYPIITAFAAWIKAFLAWTVFVGFEWWLWGQFKEIMREIQTGARPAKGNAVIGGTGAQATSLVVATAITAVVVTVPTLFWAAADAGVTNILGIVTVNPATDGSGGDNVGRALYFLGVCFPLGTCLSTFTTMATIRKYGLLLVTGVHTVVRFFVA